MINNRILSILTSSILLLASAIFTYFIIGLSIFEYKISIVSISTIYPLALFLLSLMFFVFSLATFKKEFKKNKKIGSLLILFAILFFLYQSIKIILFNINGNSGGWLGLFFVFLICLYLLLAGLRFYKGQIKLK
ncbi:MAG: hypothetical protein WC415_02985 [Patescibacteria group bacterium]|jgi:L-asparagine transporter-like permease